MRHALMQFPRVAPLIKLAAVQNRQAGLMSLSGAIHAKGIGDSRIPVERHDITGRMLVAGLLPDRSSAGQPNGARVPKTSYAVQGAKIMIKGAIFLHED